MIDPYAVFLRTEAVQALRSATATMRNRISNYIDSLAATPSQVISQSQTRPAAFWKSEIYNLKSTIS